MENIQKTEIRDDIHISLKNTEKCIKDIREILKDNKEDIKLELFLEEIKKIEEELCNTYLKFAKDI